MFRSYMALEDKDPPLVTVTQTAPADRVEATAPSAADELDQLKERDSSRYRFISEHGRGGLGRVMRTRDRELGRDVAIKEILVPGGVGEARFVREAMITARLEHPSIVPVHDAGRWPDGTPFYSMKLVSGRPLKDLLKEANSLEDRLGLLPHLIAVADAIAYAHDRAIVHRDLKPSNIIVGQFGETVVIDWGLAKDLRNSEKETSDSALLSSSPDQALTMAGAVIGTPAYMPPEQARGEDVGPSADVYALGAILYHLLSGRPPYSGASSGEVVAQVLTAPPEALEDLAPSMPRELVAVANKALARRLDERYRSAGEFVEDLRRFQTGQLVSAHEYSTTDLISRWLRKHVLVVGAGAVLISGLAVAAYITITRVMTARAEVAERERRLSVSKVELEQRTESLHLAEIARNVVEDPTSILGTVTAALKSKNKLSSTLFGLIRKADVLGIARWTVTSYGNVALAFNSPDKIALVDSRSVRILSSATGAVLTYASFDSSLGVWQSAWASDDILAIARVDGSIWRLDPSGRLQSLSSSSSADGAMAAVRAGSPLAAVAVGKNVVVLNMLEGKVVGKYPTATAPKLIAVDEGATASLDAGGLLVVRQHDGHESRCQTNSTQWTLMDFDSREAVVALADDSGTLTLLNYVSCVPVVAMQHVVRQPVFLKLVGALNTPEVVLSGKDNLTVIWNADGTRLLPGWIAAYDQTHSWLATGDTTGHIVVQSLKSEWSRTIKAHTTFVVDMAFGPTGALVTASSDGTVRAWDATMLPAITTFRSPVRSIRSQGCSHDYVVLADGHVVPWTDPSSSELNALDIDCSRNEDGLLVGAPPGTTFLTQVHRRETSWVATSPDKLFWRVDGDDQWQEWPARLEPGEQLGYLTDTATGIVVGTTHGRILSWTLGASDADVWRVAKDNDLVVRVMPLASGYVALLKSGALLVGWHNFATPGTSKCVGALTPADGDEFLVSCDNRLRIYDGTSLRVKAEYQFDGRIEKLWWSNGWALVLCGDILSVLDVRTGAMKSLPVHVSVRDAAVRRVGVQLIVYVATRQTVQTWTVSPPEFLVQGNVQEWMLRHTQATVTTGR